MSFINIDVWFEQLLCIKPLRDIHWFLSASEEPGYNECEVLSNLKKYGIRGEINETV